MPPSEPASRAWWILALVLGAAAVLYLHTGVQLSCVIEGVRYFCLADDPMISMQFARNLTEGYGLVWMAGEAPVEGYSNFLWTLWMAVGHLVLPDTHAALWIVVTSAACMLGATWFAGRIAGRLMPASRLAPILALVLAGFYFPLIKWSLVGFEVGAQAFVYTWGTWLVIAMDDPERRGRNRAWLALACTLAVLLRLDSVVFVAALCGYAVSTATDRRDRWRIVRDVGASVAVVLVLLTAWRLSYYGEWLPNTYALKIGGYPLGGRVVRGLGVLRTTLGTHLAVVVWPIGYALATSVGALRHRIVIVTGIAAQIAYMIWIGGDSWEIPESTNRQISMVMPVALALAAVGIVSAAQAIERIRGARLARGSSLAYGCLCLWVLSWPTASDWLNFPLCQGLLYHKVRLGLHLREHTPPDTKIAAVWAGALVYFAERPAVDFLGKSDPIISRMPPRGATPGHSKWSYEYSVGELRPDVIDEIWQPSDQVLQYVRDLGYREGPLGAWYREGLEVPAPPESSIPRPRM